MGWPHRALPAHPRRSRAAMSVRCSFSPDGKRLLSTCGHERLRLRPSASGTWLPASSVWPTPSTTTPCSPRLSALTAGWRPRAAATIMKFTSGMPRPAAREDAWPARVRLAGPRLSRPMGSYRLGQRTGERHLAQALPTRSSCGCACPGRQRPGSAGAGRQRGGGYLLARDARLMAPTTLAHRKGGDYGYLKPSST